MVGLAKYMANHKFLPSPPFPDKDSKTVYPVFAAVVWGVVMWLFRHERGTLQSSLQASMQYLYNDSENWKGLKTWIWHNK
jgi:peroxisomal membrane protein 4